MKTPTPDPNETSDPRRGRRGALLPALCGCAVIALAMFALLPGLPRRVTGALYDGGAFAYSGLLRGGKFSGEGRIEFAGGGSYEGGFAEGRFEGQGVFASADGWEFEGSFSGGKPVRGVFRTQEGDIGADPESNLYSLEGGWRYMGLLGVNGPRGQGEFIFADGAVYRGAFSNGLPGDGEGIYTDSSGNVIYTGGWQDGLFSGKGDYRAPDGAFTYRGSFAGGRFHGQGVVTRQDGTTLAGTWKGGWRTKP